MELSRCTGEEYIHSLGHGMHADLFSHAQSHVHLKSACF
jgi:hypothetical protein